MQETERWFARRGLPQVIDNYDSAERRVRATYPMLSTIGLCQLIVLLTDAGVAQALAIAGVIAVYAAYRYRTRISRTGASLHPGPVARALAAVQVVAFVVVPAWVAFDTAGDRVGWSVLATNLVLAVTGSIAATANVGLILRNGIGYLRRSPHIARSVAQRVLPFQLLFATFLFFTAEGWQVMHDVTGLAYAVIILVLLAAGTGFLWGRVPNEVDALDRFDSWDQINAIAASSGAPALDVNVDPAWEPTAPLDELERQRTSNLLMGELAVQVVLIGLGIFVGYLVLGALVVREATLVQWTVQPSSGPVPLAEWTMFGREYLIAKAHVAEAGFLAAFSMLQFTVALMTDQTIKREFYRSVAGDVREVLAVYARYRQYLVHHGVGEVPSTAPGSSDDSLAAHSSNAR